MSDRYTFTSESVTEGHPDKMCDQISDAVLDAIFEQDPESRVACESLATTGVVIVAGEISTNAHVDYARVVRDTVCGIGYSDSAFGFDGKTCSVITSIDRQSPDIAMGVDKAAEQRAGTGDAYDEIGAGDQGMMFGYACSDTKDLMPMPIWLAHRLAERLAAVRKDGTLDYLRPDGKTQVTIEYEDGRPKRLSTVLISTQTAPGIDILDQLHPELLREVVAPLIPEQFADDDYEFLCNPTGAFELGGPHADCGLTGRKIIVDTYGGMARHGGGAFLGEGPDEGRPLGRVRGASRRQEHGRRGHRRALRGPGGVRDRDRTPGVGDGRDVRDLPDRSGEAARSGPRDLRSPARSDHRAAGPPAADLPEDRRVRPLRARRADVHLGACRPGRAAPQGRRVAGLSAAHPSGPGRVDRVVPDVPAVDRAFDYLVPPDLHGVVRVGTIVRVPLHGRRVRGWVVATDVEPATSADRLRPMIAAVSAGPPADLVELTAFGAWRWAGPRAAFLRACSAPNIVPVDHEPEPDVAVFPVALSPLAIPDAQVRLVVWPPALPRIDLLRALVEPMGSTLVVVPDPGEASLIGAALQDEGRHVVVVRGDHPAAQRTAAWDAARLGACVVIGGRVAVFAPVPDLTGVIVLDDADAGLAEERAPAWHARDLVAERARRAGAALSLVTPAPTTEAVELSGDAIVSAPARDVSKGWPRLHVVDMRDEPPGAGLLSSALGPALHAALDASGRALCILNRRGRAHLIVCRSCGTIARCARCEARVVEGDGIHRCERCDAVEPARCRSCGAGLFRKLRPGVTSVRDAVAGLVVRHRVIAVDAASAPLPAFDVAVGTEALLHRAGADGSRRVRLVALLDFDQELLAPRFRAAEQALWLLVRSARLLGPADGGGELLVQTRVPDDEVLAAAASGDPATVVASERARRAALALPPFGGVAELRGDPDAVSAACDLVRSRLTVVGPSGGRALVRAPTIAQLCDALADVDLAPARAQGRLRVDVDPMRI